MKQQEKIKLIVLIGSIVAAILAVALLIVGIVYSGGTLAKVLIFVISFFVLALAGELGYLFMLMGNTKANYFLFNPKTNRNIAPQKLTFQIINVRMNRYLSNFASSEGKIWNARVLDNPYLEMPQEFKPLVAYKLLYGLAEKDADAGWECLENASEETLLFIYNGISMNNDKDFAFNFAQLTQRPMNIKLVRDYLIRNKRYMQGKMTKYVVENIDKF